MENEQRRRFSRIRFQSGGRLSVGGAVAACEVCDLSLKGALLQPGLAPLPGIGDACVLELVLDDGESAVRMEGEVVHRENGRIGLVCREIDLDSITHLRRLLELNLGDAELLDRELSALLG